MLAWIDINGRDRRFLLRYPFMQRIAPLLYGPRIVGGVDLGLGREPVCHIRFPLPLDCWNQLQKPVQMTLCRQLATLCDRAGGLALAAERDCRRALGGAGKFPVLFSGELFRWILLAVLAEDYLRRHVVRRVILVLPAGSETEGLLCFLCRTGVPLVLQNDHRSRTERLCWRLLHKKGLAVSCSRVNPKTWRPGDLVAGFRPELRALLAPRNDVTGLVLDESARGLSPLLEERAQTAGLPGNLGILSPLLEYYLLRHEPKVPTGELLCREEIWKKLIGSGEKSGIWHSFLDKWEAGFI